jgi:hypothetical protein
VVRACRIEIARMQRRAGHEDVSTTLGYVKMAEDLAGKSALRADRPPEPDWPNKKDRTKAPQKAVPEEGIEPPTRRV